MDDIKYIAIWIAILAFSLSVVVFLPNKKQGQLDRIERTQSEIMEKLNEVKR